MPNAFACFMLLVWPVVSIVPSPLALTLAVNTIGLPPNATLGAAAGPVSAAPAARTIL